MKKKPPKMAYVAATLKTQKEIQVCVDRAFAIVFQEVEERRRKHSWYNAKTMSDSIEGSENDTHNIAFIDGQNLHFGTKESGWSVDHKRLRTYLLEKYHITEAYYFLGFVSDNVGDLYDSLQKAGFILSFREHSSALKGGKKGNVDTDIVFSVMKKLVESEPIKQIFIVSGDGDYIKLVDYLISKNRFGKMLFPNRKFASSLYKKFGGEFFDYLEDPDVKAKIAYEQKQK